MYNPASDQRFLTDPFVFMFISSCHQISCSIIAIGGAVVVSSAMPAGPSADWMVNPAPYKAGIIENKSTRELTLENGLARRVIRLAPNAATITLENLASGEHLLRAVAPEARVTSMAPDYPVGGLTGQGIQNYLKQEWIKDLRPLPGAYQFSGWEEQPVSKRLEWKKRPEWLATDHPWPPPGKHVVMHYDPPVGPCRQSIRSVALEENVRRFRPTETGWTVTASKAHPRSSFSNEGKSGEIMALPDTSVFAERAWPDGRGLRRTHPRCGR